MTIEEFKSKVVSVQELIGGGMIYDEDGLPDDWELLAEELAKTARHIMVGGSRVAAYAGIARRKANLGQ